MVGSHEQERFIQGLHSWPGPNDGGAGTKDDAGTSETNSNVPGSASGSEEGPKAGTDAETSVGITAPLGPFNTADILHKAPSRALPTRMRDDVTF